MPTTPPRTLNSGPPELPGLIATSAWMNGTKLFWGRPRARDEAPEEVVEGIDFLDVGDLRPGAALARLSGADVDDGRALLLRELGKIRKLAPLCEQRGRHPQQQVEKQRSRHRDVLDFGFRRNPRGRPGSSIMSPRPGLVFFLPAVFH